MTTGQQMKQCPNCGNKVPEYATKCKYCDYQFEQGVQKFPNAISESSQQKNNSSNRNGIYFLIIVIGVLVIMQLLGVFSKKDNSDAERNRKLSSAWTFCKFSIEDHLIAPSTADFEWYDAKNSVKELEDGIYLMDITVDSENLFGAKIRSEFICKVQNKGEDWKILELRLKE